MSMFSASDKKATGVRTTVQRRTGAKKNKPTYNESKDDKRAVKHSAFMVTVNTNMAIDNDVEADEWAEKLADAVDSIGFKGSSCSTWGHFFKVNVGRGKKWLDKKGTKPNPKYNENYNAFYAEDDKQGIEHWCEFFESLHIQGGGVEWAPGTKNGKNQYLHAHIFIKVKHRTRLLVDRDYLAQWFWDKVGLPHKPYVHVDVVMDNTVKVIDYITKNGSEELRDAAMEFFVGE